MFPNWTGWKSVKILLFILTGFAPLVPDAYRTLYTTALASVGSIVVVLSGTPMGPAVVGKAVAKILPIVLCIGALAVGAEACSAAQVKAYTDGSGQLCQVVLQASDPALAPLCTTAQAVAEAIEAIVASRGSDAGVGAASPTNDEVYAYLKAHGAVPAVAR